MASKLKPTQTALQKFESDWRAFPSSNLSLHRFWRSVGSPSEKSPSFWLALASKLVEGMVEYQHRLCIYDCEQDEPDENGFSLAGDLMKYPDALAYTNTPEMIQSRKQFGHEEPWEPGDTLAIPELAFLYCMFLDGLGEADIIRERDKQEEPKKSKRPLEPGETPILKMTTVSD